MSMGCIGTFNPVHLAHLRNVRTAMRSGAGKALERVSFFIKEQPPEKVGSTLIPVNHRINMLDLATHRSPRFPFQTTIDYGNGPDLLNWMGKVSQDEPMPFVVGEDVLDKIASGTSIFSKAPSGTADRIRHLLVVPRGQKRFSPLTTDSFTVNIQDRPVTCHPLPVKPSPFSSSEVRARIAYHPHQVSQELSGIVPTPVTRYIVSNNLYGAHSRELGELATA